MSLRRLIRVVGLAAALFAVSCPAGRAGEVEGSDKNVVLVDVAGACPTVRYDAPKEKFTARQLAWLKTLINFLYSSAFDGGAPKVVSPSEMAVLAKSPSFRGWVGDEVTNLVNTMVDSRFEMEGKPKANPQAVTERGPNGRRNEPATGRGSIKAERRYLAAREQLDALFESRFGLLKIKTEQPCGGGDD